jgi:branched-chain amino acid aminotransferase
VAQLQRPELVYMNGKLTPWEDASLHIGCEAVTRGLNVYEGLKGYWQPDETFQVVDLYKHYVRLSRSSKLLHIPFPWTYGQYEEAVGTLLGALAKPDRDMWARTTLYVTEGHWGEGTAADLVVTAYHQPKQDPSPIDVGVSTWQRSTDISLPARIKTGTNYQVARLARIEGRSRGWHDMILLNQWGRVAEAAAACVLIVRDGVIITPPPSEGALESITLEAIEHLAGAMGIPVVRRPVERTELLIADEMALVGTITEVTLIKSIDGLPILQPGPILGKLQKQYLDTVRGIVRHPSIAMTAVPKEKMVSKEVFTGVR